MTALQRRGVEESSHDELEDDDDEEVASLDDNDSTFERPGKRRKDIANSDHTVLNETEGYCSSNDVNPSFQYPQANTKDASLQISPSRIMPDG